MSSLQSIIYYHCPNSKHFFYSGRCKCGEECPELTDWAKHLAEVIQKEFIDVTPIPALPPKAELNTEAAASSMFSHSYPNEPARPKEEPPDTIKVEVSINGELHTVINVKPKRLPL